MTSHSNYVYDRPATEDSLGRTHFANALSRSLVLPKGSPGLVVGIEGNWGSGKSTLIGFITKRLNEIAESNTPIVVEFNPWMVSDTGALVEALIGQVAASIGKNFPDGKAGVKVSQKLLGYVGLLKNLKYVPGLSWAGHAAEDLPELMKTIATVAEQGTEAGQKVLNDFEKLLPSWDISKKRKEVVEALEALDHPIVIVIDDLDRLPAEEIRAMIQAIKAVADFPRTTYLLAYDRDVVACALAADKESGLSYLEKIVQVAYPIPPLSQRQLKQFSNEKVQTLLKTLHITLRDYEEARYEKAMSLLTGLARHPRDVIRTLNRLTLSLPATHGEVNVADVIVFEALSQRFPALRDAIREHPADFIGHPFRDDLLNEESDFDWGSYFKEENKEKTEQPWLKYLPQGEHVQRVSKMACLFLFKPEEKNNTRIIPENYLGIADPDRLARLFRMTSIEEVPEVKEIHDLLQNPEKFKDVLNEDEQLLFWLEWLINYTPSCSKLNISGCIENLAAVSLDLTSQCRLTDDAAKKFATLMERLLRLKSSEYEKDFLHIAQSASLSISERIVLTAAQETGKWGSPHDYQVSEDRQLISSSIADQGIQIWLKRVQESVDQDNLYKEANLRSILYRFAQLNNDAYDTMYNAISRMCQTDEGLAAFLKYFVKESFSHRDNLMLVENAEKLAQRITHSALNDEYSWLVKLLGEDTTINFIQAQTAKHRNKIPDSASTSNP